MDKSWAISGVDLHLDLSGNRVRAGLEAALREAVQTGRLVPGTRLPSTRALAADLGIARNTVAEAYSQLTAEGWLTAQQGSGTRVAATAEVPVASEATTGASSQTRQSRYDLRPGSPNLSAFPRAGWLSATRWTRGGRCARCRWASRCSPTRRRLRLRAARCSGSLPRRRLSCGDLCSMEKAASCD